jgi:hypothetical protein
VARTSELTLFPSGGAGRAETVRQAQLGAQPPLLVARRGIPALRAGARVVEPAGQIDPLQTRGRGQLESTLAYYQRQIEQQRWYGYWDFGDVMHSYDRERHVWNYDLGGMAWDNTELGTDMWLWFSFLRTGRADLFRMAEAMTRHTSEVDCYHLGPLAGLGSRHNVRHWGCGAKEARISMAALKRPILLPDDGRAHRRPACARWSNADFTALEFDPMRIAQPATEARKNIRRASAAAPTGSPS